MKKNRSQTISRINVPFMHGVLDYRRFFGKAAPEDPVENLLKYPTDVLIIMLARVNAIIFGCGGDPNQIDNDVFRLVFDKMDKRIYEHLAKIRSTDIGRHGAIFTPQAIVGLMAKLIARYRPVNNEDSISDVGLKIMKMDLFDAILAVNEHYYNSANNGDLMSLDHLWKLELLQQRFAREIRNMYGVNPLKVFLFFRFMGESYGENILKEFADAFGVASAYNFYFVFLQTIVSSYSSYEKTRNPRYCIVDDTLQKVLEPFVYDPSKPQKTPFSGESFALINQPFYRFSEGIAVLDFSFFAHLTDISLIYHFYKATSLKKNHGIKNYNEYLGMIGKHFYEEYLTVQIIKKLFTHKYDKVLTEKDEPLFPDILIMQNNKDLFVIEVKSTRVHGRVLDEADTYGFQTFLEEFFATEKEGPDQKNKGIFQLRKQIQHLKSHGRKFRIFPIIIYTEPSMDISGVNSFLDQKFDEIIADERSFFTKIHPLTLINLHFLIKYYPHLKEERYFFRDKIIEYHDRKKSQLKEATKKDNGYIYFIAQYSFMRMMEQTYPVGEPISYFKKAVTDFGFGEEAKAAEESA